VPGRRQAEKRLPEKRLSSGDSGGEGRRGGKQGENLESYGATTPASEANRPSGEMTAAKEGRGNKTFSHIRKRYSEKEGGEYLSGLKVGEVSLREKRRERTTIPEA